ncbi:predicted protein [Sclerotinia sclerotiorum 1980 UF-70]|uniref:Uncharacterized protein n=1 Tax=Sclerotinia sclerotiorum (strain ATCC 18683 / 1980 / Ss-1) TaxID=665079 RepID=A7EDM5_SCLS1|nr:predicted protein [Sclerotinia sclerotiorum 1980 UF-70]EDO00941.1 predicted protein [Sclerotinia sclerotiorum 1980 UF-70]
MGGDGMYSTKPVLEKSLRPFPCAKLRVFEIRRNSKSLCESYLVAYMRRDARRAEDNDKEKVRLQN